MRPLDGLIRLASMGGIVLLVARRWVYLFFPKFLPSRAWIPASSLSRWAGAITSGVFAMVMILILLGVPFCFYFYGRLFWRSPNVRHLLIDATFAVGLYVTAWFLLSPPS
jgi:hypothetical protein